MRVDAAGVTVRNGAIRGFASGLITSAAGTEVTGLSLMGTGAGVTLRSHGNHVRGNLVVDTDTGFRLQGSANLVTGNALRRTGNGIVVSGSDNRIVGNSIVGDDDPDVGILVFASSSGTEVSANSVSGQPSSTGIRSDGFDSRITGNQVFGNLDGIRVAWGTVTGNRVFSNGANGIDLEFAGSVVAAANTTFGNGRLGIQGGPGAFDGGANRAFANGDPRQCTVVVCSP